MDAHNVTHHGKGECIRRHCCQEHIAGGFGHHIHVDEEVVTCFTWAFSGSDPKATATIDNGKTFPARAVFDGVAGAIIKSGLRLHNQALMLYRLIYQSKYKKGVYLNQ